MSVFEVQTGVKQVFPEIQILNDDLLSFSNNEN